MEENELRLPNDWMRKIDDKPISYDFMETVICYLIFFPVLAIITNYFSGNIIFIAIIVLLSLLLMTFNRLRCKSKLRYYLFQLMIITANLLVISGKERWCVLVFIVFSAYISRSKRLRKRITFYTNFQMILGETLFYILYLIASGMKMGFISTVIIFHSIFLFIICEIYIHNSRSYALIKWEQSNMGLSIKKIKNFNIMFIIWISLIIAFVGFIGFKLYYYTGANNIDNNIIYNIKKAGDPFNIFNSDKPVYVPQPTLGIKDNSLLKSDNNIMNIILMIYFIIIYLLSRGIFFLVSIFILVILSKRILKFLTHKTALEEEERKFIFSFKDSVSEIKENVVDTGRRLQILWDASNNGKIRKLYFKNIEKYVKKGLELSDSDTTEEIGVKISEVNCLDIEKINKIYRKARYGKEQCSELEVKILKDVLKN